MTRVPLECEHPKPVPGYQAPEPIDTDSLALKDEAPRTSRTDQKPACSSTRPSVPTIVPLRFTQPDTRLVNAKLLIPGRGDPIADASVMVQSGTITWVGPTKALPDLFKGLPSTSVPYLMPGLWDCHTHLLGLESLNFASLLTTHPATMGARIARSAHDILMSGVTSIRELGGHALEVAPAIKEGTIAGPNVYSAGAAISQTAGHGDVFDMPLGFTQAHLGVRDTDANAGWVGQIGLVLADGVDEVRRAVRIQVRRGAHVIKVLASGGVLSIADDPLRQQYSDLELRTFVEEAERHGRVVAAHVHGKAGIMAALRAGVKTIEHGTYMDEECIKLIKDNDVVYVPTRTIVKVGVEHPEIMSPESYKKMVETAKHHLSAYKLAVKHGVKIALGTDLGISVPASHPLALGKGGQELVHAVEEAGMTPLQAIEAATSMGPSTLGGLGMAPKSGQIKVGYDADFIGLEKNPLEHIELFANPANIKYVYKGGKLFKHP